MSVKKILAAIRKADHLFDLIQDGDKIGVGISGGKDSTLLLYTLSLYKHVAKNVFNKHFDVVGIHLDMNFGEESFETLNNFYKENNIECVVEKTKIADILNLHKKNDKIQCSLCSPLKKGAVVKVAKKIGCNKVAFGHHIDDAIETMFLNMIYGGKISTFDPIMHLSNSDITFIRPFALIDEKLIKRCIKELNLIAIKSGCPNDGHTKRQDIKDMLNEIYKTYPQAKHNFKNMLINHENLNIYHKLIKDIDK